MRLCTGLGLMVIAAGCLTEGAPSEAAFDEQAWERENVGKPARFTGTGGGSSGSSDGSGSMQAEANLTLRPPTVTCRVASASTVSCVFEMPWTAEGGDDIAHTSLQVSFPSTSEPAQTCEAPAGDVCTLNGTVAIAQTVNATHPYPDFTAAASLEASSFLLATKAGSKSGELEWREHFTVRFRDGRPIPDDSQAPLTMHASKGRISI